MATYLKNNLYKIRTEDLKLTCKTMAQNLGVSHYTYRAYEDLKCTLSPIVAIKIHQLYGYSLDYIYDITQENNKDAIMKTIKDKQAYHFEEYLKLATNTPIRDPQKFISKLTRNEYPYNLLTDIFKVTYVEQNIIDELLSHQLTLDQYHGLNFVLSKLTPRQQFVVECLYKHNNTLEQTGMKVGVTRERIRQIQVKIWHILRRPENLNYIIDGYAVYTEKIRQRTTTYHQIIHQIKHKKQKPIVDFENTPIESLQLSCRSYNCLKRANIHTVAELQRVINENRLSTVRNLGRKSQKEILSTLSHK